MLQFFPGSHKAKTKTRSLNDGSAFLFSPRRLRHARAQERLRRENMNRLRALRRMHRQQRNGEGTDNPRHLPFADTPPAYNNLGFVPGEDHLTRFASLLLSRFAASLPVKSVGF